VAYVNLFYKVYGSFKHEITKCLSVVRDCSRTFQMTKQFNTKKYLSPMDVFRGLRVQPL